MPEDLKESRCRDCASYDLSAVLSSNGRVLTQKVARCRFEVVYPASVTEWNRRRPGYMQPNDGAGCPCFSPTNRK